MSIYSEQKQIIILTPDNAAHSQKRLSIISEVTAKCNRKLQEARRHKGPYSEVYQTP